MSSPPPPYLRLQNGAYITQTPDGTIGMYGKDNTLILTLGNSSSTPGQINISASGKVGQFANLATQGLGLAAVYASNGFSQQTTTQTNFLNYTPPATAGQYLVLVAEIVNSVTGGSIQSAIAFKDARGNARTVTLASRTTTGFFSETPTFIFIDNSATAITVTSTLAATINADGAAALLQVG